MIVIILVTTVRVVSVWSAATIFAQTDNTLTFGFAHGTADSPETVLVFTSPKGARLLALADKKGDYRVALEPGQYCVSAYTSSGDPLPLSPQQKCIEVTARKDVRLDVMISRTVAVSDVPARTVEQAGEIEAQVLAGKIVNAASLPIPEVLVELLSSDGKRIEAVLTDSKGKFVMKPRAPWVYPVRVSKPGFDTLLLKVRVSKTGKRELALTLTSSQ